MLSLISNYETVVSTYKKLLIQSSPPQYGFMSEYKR